MRLDRYIKKSRIIDLKSTTFEGALEELLEVTPYQAMPNGPTKSALLTLLLEREKAMTTCLGNGIAIPHIRVPMQKPSYLFAMGRCPDGLEYEGMEAYKKTQFVFLLLASDKEKSYINLLASIVRLFQVRSLIKRLSEQKDIRLFREKALQAFGGSITRATGEAKGFNQLILKEAEKIAKGTKSTSILVFGDTFSEEVDLSQISSRFKTILITQSPLDFDDQTDSLSECIVVKSFSNNRLSQLRSAILMGLTRGIIKNNERICCIAGLPHSGQLDTLVVVDVEKEFQFYFYQTSHASC